MKLKILGLGNLAKTVLAASNPGPSQAPAQGPSAGGSPTTGRAVSAASPDPKFSALRPPHAAKVHTKQFVDGVYVGTLVNGKREGRGQFTRRDTWLHRSHYVGDWHEDQPHGRGEQRFPNGHRYVGEFQKGRRHGQGEMNFAGGNRYVGEFQAGEAHGQGQYFYASGARYVGGMNQGQPHGHGQMFFANGNHYVGDIRECKMHGAGEYTHANGSRYAGNFESGKKSGRGHYTVANGYSYGGLWKDGEFIEEETPAPPLVHAGFEHKVQREADAGRFIVGWIRYLGQNLMLNHPLPKDSPQAHLYEVMRTTFQRRIASLAELTARGRELVAAVAAPGDELALLVRCPVDQQSDVRHDYVSRIFTQFPSVETLDRGGRVAAYAYVPADPEAGASAQHLLIWDRTERAEHQVFTVAASDLKAHVRALKSSSWTLAGCAGDAQGYVGILRRMPEHSLSVAPHERADQLLLAAAPEAAAAAIEAMCGTAPQAEHAGLRALAEALRQRAAVPWEAYRGLATAIEQPPMGLDREALRLCLKQTMRQDMQANRLSSVCTAMASHPVHASLAQHLAKAILDACANSAPVDTATPLAAANSAPVDAATPLAAAIAARSVEATTFMAALGLQDPDSQAKAEATGLPALVAAASGDLEGLRQWERLGTRARNALQWMAQRAAEHSRGASEGLQRRLMDLLEISPDEVASLRRFIQRADVWINFPGNADNRLLASTAYQPDASKRTELERHRFAGHYHDGPLPREELPKYGWLNAHKSRLGLSPFGDSALVLQPHVQLRTNWILRDDFETNVGVGTSVSMDHIIMRLSNQVLRELYAASRGERLERPAHIVRQDADFVEVQVHGPLDIQQDVRKVVAPTSALAKSAVPLSRFAKRVQLPLRWRDAGKLKAEDRPQYIAALGHTGLSVAAWTSQGDVDRLLLHPAANRSEPTRYELHAAPVQELLALINSVARGQQEIVGLRLDPPNNQVNGRTPFATLLVREAAEPVDYTVRRTAQLSMRLRQMEANGLVVCAYAQEAQSNAPLPLHVLVARQAAEDEAFTHKHVTTDFNHLDAVRATQVAAGWTVCGLATTDGNAYTLILRQPTTPPAAPDDEKDTTLVSGEPLSTVPESLRFRDDAGNLFDVEELVEIIAQKGVFKNFYSNQALTEAETQRLLNHPSGAGARLRGMQTLQSAWRAAITPDTRAKVFALADLLESEDTAGPLTGSTQAVAAFESFASSRSPQEQAALHAGRFALTDTHGQPFSLTVMEALSGLQRGTGCSRATASYLKKMMGEAAAV